MLCNSQVTFAYDFITINFPQFGNNCHFPPDVSVISKLNYAILRFNSCFKKVFLKAVKLQLFYWSKNSSSNIRLQWLLYHFIENFVPTLLTVNNFLWCLLWKYFCSDKVLLNPVGATSKHQVVLILASLVAAYKSH